MTPAISVSHLNKIYASGFQALKDINLEIRSGEIFALLGPNGAGKTTLISIICGIVKASSGRVLVAGHDINSEYRTTRSLIGLVPQELANDMFTSVWSTASFSRGLFGKPSHPGLHSKGAQGSFALGEERRQDRHSFRRHEAPRDDRQGAGA